MSRTGLRDRWLSGQPLLGTWCSLPSPYVVELLASVGFDWICVDLQHGLATETDLPAMLQAADAAAVPVLVRVRSLEPAAISRALDLGAVGVIVPLVDGVEQAQAAVGACRYPPDGDRSWGPMRPVADGSPVSPAEAPLCVVMAETAAAIAAIDEVAAVAGVDGVFVGPADLSLSTSGRLGADLGEALDRVAAACRSAGIVAGIACPDAGRAAKLYEAGYRLLTVQWDVAFLAAGARAALEAARGAVATVPDRAVG